ncbi:MAG: undecaprenyl-diphosphate phosphatase [Bacteroidia bacterium]|nr:undecaprenyl-diphosphate phosphatase [Bacteroidia bacterium]MDW8303066.1 undecaprenyl-diphosphate phosphatase [Bacteroidia bacterium]
MSLIQAIILAIVEGITEFLPISSTGHIIIASSIMGIETHDFTKTYTVMIQFGAILSVLSLYWKRLLYSREIYLNLALAFIPTAVLGFLFNDWIDKLLESPLTVSISLIVGGIVLIFVDKWFKQPIQEPQQLSMSVLSAVKIGLFQSISMIPGISRSAASIIGGMVVGLTRKQAAEFSFLLAIPTMLAAASYKLYKYLQLMKNSQASLSDADWTNLIVGNVVAFVVAIIAIKVFVHWLTRYGFKWFGLYRILVGVGILSFLLFN